MNLFRCNKTKYRNIRVPGQFFNVCQRVGILPSEWVVVINTSLQEMWLFRRIRKANNKSPFTFAHHRWYDLVKKFKVSTSKYGIGQENGSFKTPLGLHRIARKIGGGYPAGTVFVNRVPVGYTWNGKPNATIVHRILWLEGLEEGYNRGGKVDTFLRYIYIHGFSDETTIGKPTSHGCIHLRADDLLPLYDIIPVGTLVWITPNDE